MRKIYAVIWLIISVVATGQAQRIVRGTVRIAPSKEELPGVTILLKGTKTGTSTDMQGRYQLALPHDTATLVFSFVGFEPLEKKIIVTQDTAIIFPIYLKEMCSIDFFHNKYIEFSLLSGLRYTPLGGKAKIFYPYLLHAQRSMGSLRAEFSYQLGNTNYQHNGTLALDNALVNCDNNVDVTIDYQSVKLGEQGVVYTRYSVGATYTGKMISRVVPIYLAVGRLCYLNKENSGIKTGIEIGADYPLSIYHNDSHTNSIQLMVKGRVAWWQSYWQFQSGVEAQIKRFSFKVNFNKLGQYTEINTGVGFRFERRYHTKGLD